MFAFFALLNKSSPQVFKYFMQIFLFIACLQLGVFVNFYAVFLAFIHSTDVKSHSYYWNWIKNVFLCTTFSKFLLRYAIKRRAKKKFLSILIYVHEKCCYDAYYHFGFIFCFSLKLPRVRVIQLNFRFNRSVFVK